jgi:hypothetical protein
MAAVAMPNSKRVEELVSRLCETAFAHELAARRLRSRDCRRTVGGAARLYRQHCAVLLQLTAELGRPIAPSQRPRLARRWQLRWALRGNDTAVMRRLCANHAAIHAAQESVLGDTCLQGSMRTALERQRADSKRVGAWLAHRESELVGRRHGRSRLRSSSGLGNSAPWARTAAAAPPAE